MQEAETSKIIIVGAGGFGREIVEYLSSNSSHGESQSRLYGVIDDNPEPSTHQVKNLPYLGRILDFQPQADQLFLLAIGNPSARRKVARRLQEKSAHFMTYRHPQAIFAQDAKIGVGSVICPFSIINSGAELGEFTVVNVFGSVGHGAFLGAFSVMSPYAALNGDAKVGEECFLGTRATIFPQVSLGNQCSVDTHSFVKMSTGDRKIISVRGQYLEINNRLR